MRRAGLAATLALFGLAIFGGVLAAQAGPRQDDTRIVFVVRDRGVSRIYTIRPDGSDLRLVSRLPLGLSRGGDIKPAWSPDGRWIAFARVTPVGTEERVEIYVVRPDGSGLRRITRGMARIRIGFEAPRVLRTFDTQPTWSPDGRWIAFSRVTAPGASWSWIFRARVDGKRVLHVTEGRVFNFSPAWSPDGRLIAYFGALGAAPGEAIENLADVSLGFQPLRGRAFGPGGGGVDVAWSPDGSKLASARSRGGQGGQGRTCLRHGNLGRYIVGLDPTRPHARDHCIPNGEIWIASLSGDSVTAITRLTMSAADDRHPSWSPDGSTLVFSSGFNNGIGPRPALYVMPATGGVPKRLYAAAKGAALDPAWSPVPVPD